MDDCKNQNQCMRVISDVKGENKEQNVEFKKLVDSMTNFQLSVVQRLTTLEILSGKLDVLDAVLDRLARIEEKLISIDSNQTSPQITSEPIRNGAESFLVDVIKSLLVALLAVLGYRFFF